MKPQEKLNDLNMSLSVAGKFVEDMIIVISRANMNKVLQHQFLKTAHEYLESRYKAMDKGENLANGTVDLIAGKTQSNKLIKLAKQVEDELYTIALSNPRDTSYKKFTKISNQFVECINNPYKKFEVLNESRRNDRSM